jgi:hypothetical protein
VTPFDRDALRQLGRELSYRFGVTVILALEEETVVHFVIHDQGRMVDEYLSVPEYYGPLPARRRALRCARIRRSSPG